MPHRPLSQIFGKLRGGARSTPHKSPGGSPGVARQSGAASHGVASVSRVSRCIAQRRNRLACQGVSRAMSQLVSAHVQHREFPYEDCALYTAGYNGSCWRLTPPRLCTLQSRTYRNLYKRIRDNVARRVPDWRAARQIGAANTRKQACLDWHGACYRCCQTRPVRCLGGWSRLSAAHPPRMSLTLAPSGVSESGARKHGEPRPAVGRDNLTRPCAGLA